MAASVSFYNMFSQMPNYMSEGSGLATVMKGAQLVCDWPLHLHKNWAEIQRFIQERGVLPYSGLDLTIGEPSELLSPELVTNLTNAKGRIGDFLSLSIIGKIPGTIVRFNQAAANWWNDDDDDDYNRELAYRAGDLAGDVFCFSKIFFENVALEVVGSVGTLVCDIISVQRHWEDLSKVKDPSSKEFSSFHRMSDPKIDPKYYLLAAVKIISSLALSVLKVTCLYYGTTYKTVTLCLSSVKVIFSIWSEGYKRALKGQSS